MIYGLLHYLIFKGLQDYSRKYLGIVIFISYLRIIGVIRPPTPKQALLLMINIIFHQQIIYFLCDDPFQSCVVPAQPKMEWNLLNQKLEKYLNFQRNVTSVRETHVCLLHKINSFRRSMGDLNRLPFLVNQFYCIYYVVNHPPSPQ